jgi:2,3-bisphosphoglycerate-dependent phosphoglycerate mutase
MKRLLFIVAVLISTAVYSQSTVTTFVLVRHAEKGNDGTADPELSEAGKQRAESLIKFLKKTKVDAIYSTSYKRTRNTVAPLAQSKNLVVEMYNPSKPEEIDAMIQKYKGGTIILVGHSNTTPAVLNYLTGHKDEFAAFDDSDYSNLIIVSVIERGNAKVTWLNY